MSTAPGTIDALGREQVIYALVQTLNEHYVFPDTAQAMQAAILRRHADGAYNHITTGTSLAQILTDHLHELSHDKHLALFYTSEPQPLRELQPPTPAEIEQWRDEFRAMNFGFQKVERLPGNIGYLDLRAFCPPALAGETAVAVMNVLANTYALIIDLRKNSGGDPGMIALLASYLFDAPTQLNSVYWRKDNRTDQFWTLPYVPGKRFGQHKPVYILTSSATFSAAEAFTYDLKNHKRATIVGEGTGGGAHLINGLSLDPHFRIAIPIGRAINPLSQTNWEAVGVVPDIAVPSDAALNVAQVAALKAVLEELADAPSYQVLAEEIQTALAVEVESHAINSTSPGR